jgi:hypothetical protein
MKIERRLEMNLVILLNRELTINAPVVFMERDVMDFWREICITRASYRGGPKKVENSGPTPITGPSNAYFPP